MPTHSRCTVPPRYRYILALRAALDNNGFNGTEIVAADGGTDVISAAAKDSELADAIYAFGLHAHVLAYETGIPFLLPNLVAAGMQAPPSPFS